MPNRITNGKTLALITQWAYLVSGAFILASLVIMIAVLAHALGGGILAYGTACALVMALTVLVLFVLMARPQPTEPRAEMNGHIIQPQRDKTAA